MGEQTLGICLKQTPDLDERRKYVSGQTVFGADPRQNCPTPQERLNVPEIGRAHV
jgi:hypothetical protein